LGVPAAGGVAQRGHLARQIEASWSTSARGPDASICGEAPPDAIGR